MKTKKLNLRFILSTSCGIGLITLLTAAAPTQGDYTKDVTRIQVNNPAQDAVAQINEILCIINKTNYSYFVGKGPTLALVDQNTCATSGSPGEQSNGSNASSAPDYFNIVFDAPERPSTADPQTVKLWISGNMGDSNNPQAVLIQGKLTVSASPTTTNPYGLFSFEFTGAPKSNPTANMMQGYIRSEINSEGQQQLVFAQKSDRGDKAETNQVILIGNGTANGYGKLLIPDFHNGSETLQQMILAYDSNDLLQQTNGSTNKCYNRNDVSSVVYQYGVYNSDGSALIAPNSGYPIIYNGQHGYLSYYGIGLPNNVAITNNSAVTYFDNNHTPLSGKMIAYNGKLNQLSTKEYSLDKLSGIQLSVPASSNPNEQGFSSNIIEWNKNTQAFVKVATQTCSNNGGCTTTPLATPTPFVQADFAPSVQVSGGNGSGGGVGTVNLWISGLGGGGNTQLALFSNCSYPIGGGAPTCTVYNSPTNATKITVWENNLVAPTTAGSPITYYCVNQCPYLANGNWQWGNPIFDGTGGIHPYITYSFNPSNYTLIGTSGEANGQTIAVTSSSQGNIMSGPLLTEAQYNILSNNSTTPANMSLLYGGTISSYLQWQSGSDSYNKYINIRADSTGQPLPLNAPLQLVYTDSNGSNLFLQYSGIGNLQGIPGICVDSNDNPVAMNECGSPGNNWKPAYTIPTGAELTDSSGTNKYFIKQLFVAQLMKANGVCSDLESQLGLANDLTLPSVTGLAPVSNGTTPDISTVSVINGVNQ